MPKNRVKSSKYLFKNITRKGGVHDDMFETCSRLSQAEPSAIFIKVSESSN